ncbi:hypothetical protein LTS18_007938 [Coniosporium uncinatum]|uniref:Uncharacterized protein n=1 Tax=Coniosporium uncinatum TaxID=93489 RepID=A0ACC3DXB6_9PEZI|nr:hypothetical protein LTS18_007938 [Coniosporium uncinatum]
MSSASTLGKESFLEDTERTAPPAPKRPTTPHTASLWALLLVLTLITLTLLILHTTPNHAPPSPPQITPYNASLLRPTGCGTTPASASSTNCTFDIMNFGYTPNECFYPSLAASALPSPPLAWWTHRNNATGSVSGPLSQTTSALQNHSGIWTEHTYHVQHCIYAFKVLHHAALERAQGKGSGLVPEGFASWGHTLHCEEVLGDRRWDRDSRVVSAQIFRLEVRCVGVGEEEEVKYGGD